MRSSKGGITLHVALDLNMDDLEKWIEASAELDRRIDEATKSG